MDYHIIFKQAKFIEQYQIELKENFVQTLSAKTQVNKKNFKENMSIIVLTKQRIGILLSVDFLLHKMIKSIQSHLTSFVDKVNMRWRCH